MTSTRLTQQTGSREALRVATHRPHRPLPATRGTAPTRHTVLVSTSTQYKHRTAPLPVVLPQGRPRTRPTHAHGWAGGCCVVGAPTRSPLGPAWQLGGPRDHPKGGHLSSPALSNAIDLPRRRRVGDRRARQNPASRSLANLSQAGGDTSPAVLAPLLAPLDLIPPRLAPSWPLRWA